MSTNNKNNQVLPQNQLPQGKPPWKSKTLITNSLIGLVPTLLWLSSLLNQASFPETVITTLAALGISADPTTIAAIIIVLSVSINYFLRFITTEPVILPATRPDEGTPQPKGE